MISVVIADDHGLIRKGVKLLLDENVHIDVIGEASDGDEALKKVSELSPQVLITDISMPGIMGIDLTQKVRSENPGTQVLILSNYLDVEHILESYEAGALGYLPKNAEEELLVNALYDVSAGKTYYAPEVLKIIGEAAMNNKGSGKSLKATLTDREKEVLKELVEGKTNKEIAETLFISSRTVDAHRRNIMKKMGVNNSAMLVKKSMEHNLV